ncbi:hypothetical protein F4803DRAFT_97694 [Xylaria telfairii]|nr:hypothetical protein F4803DRAFT_97694 [Xylaria telfairii]
MSPKHSIKSNKSHHHRRHSYQPRSVGSSSRSQRGRSRSRDSRRARSSSPLLRSRSRSRSHTAITPSRFSSHSRSRPRKLRHRDVPIYIPSSEQHTHAIPIIIAEALRQQSQEHHEALEPVNLGNRLPTPPPDPNPNPNTQAAARNAAPGLKRRPSSSPAAAKARRRRRRRPRARQQSVPSDQDEPVLPPQPEPAYPAAQYSFFGIIRAKAEKEKREAAAKRKRDEERRRKRKQVEGAKKRRNDGDNGADTPRKPTHNPLAEEPSTPLPRRSNSAPPLSRSPIQGYPHDYPYDDEQQEPRTASERKRHKQQQQQQQQQQQRRKKHHRRSGEQHHRRQKRRSSRYVMRDFFASLRRKLGNFFRLTVPAPPAPAPRLDYSTPQPTRDPAGGGFGAQYYGSEGGRASESQAQARRRKRRTPMQQPLPYFMHGGRSPGDSWHARLSRPGSTRRFTTATAESAPESPRFGGEFPRFSPSMGMGMGPGVPRFSQHSSGSTISIIARRFMGPFLSEPSSEVATTVDGGGLLQRRLSWRSYKLLTAGSRPATPPSSRNASPEGRGRSKSREEDMSIPGAYRSSSTSMGLRNLYDATSSPEPEDRRARSASPPYRVAATPEYHVAATPEYRVSATPEYGGLAVLFATPLRVSSPVSASSAYVRIPSGDYGLQRLFTTPAAAGSGSSSNFGLRRLFGE